TPGHCRRAGTICREDEECCSGFCDPTTGRCACTSRQGLCAKTRTCVTCDPFDQTFNSTTCLCDCVPGTEACGGHCCFAGTCGGVVCAGTCDAGAGTCDTGFAGCGRGCYMFSTAEGGCVCAASASCADLQPCSNSADCPAGTTCT